MSYINYFIIVLTLYLAFILARYASKYNQAVARNKRKFWDKESEANSVRRADISGLDYIRLPLDTFPLDEALAKGLKSQVEELKKLAQKDILNLSAYSNTDLKLMYGPANLDVLSQCDENYTLLIKTLNKIGDELIKEDSPSAALTFLEYAVSIDTSITQTYVNLGTIYQSNGEIQKLDNLISKASGIEGLSGPTIVTKLNNIKSGEK